ncbi:hypothetical protein [Neptunomonas japonica]|uniref:hypothetical protein n=1 Tax=Neptunomonas japonica TaxID=417574 RepID=UPI0012EC1272|nr:hypothetical protein [Neptunomonas japonica]
MTSYIQGHDVTEAVNISARRATRSSVVSIVRFPLNTAQSTASIPARVYSTEYFSLYKKAPWVSDFYGNSKSLDNVKSLLPYYKSINELLKNHEYETCNSFLRFVKAKDLSDVLLVGLLRLTSSWKDDLPEWTRLLSSVTTEMSSRGKDPLVSLKGLI